MQTWQKLVSFPNDLLAQVDPVEMNLVCAEGLPGAESIDRPLAWRAFDHYAKTVQAELRRARPIFDQNPSDYNNSKPYFRMLVLLTVMQRDIGVRYDAELIDRDDFFADARNVFVHGVLHTKRGTCSSLPPFYAAIGRRLGYPVRVVTCKSHQFLRWDDPRGERFNIECTCKGLICHPDEHYLRWPFPASQDEVERWRLLKSKSPREELGLYLANRGHCLLDNHRFREAVEAYAWSAELDCENHLASSTLCHTMDRWRARLQEVWPQDFPRMTIRFPPTQFRTVPRDLEQAIIHLRTMDDLFANEELNGRWWEPLRAGRKPSDLPEHMSVAYESPSDFRVTFQR